MDPAPDPTTGIVQLSTKSFKITENLGNDKLFNLFKHYVRLRVCLKFRQYPDLDSQNVSSGSEVNIFWIHKTWW